MSTPIEVYDPVSRDSVFVDEAGTCTIWVEPHNSEKPFVDFSLEGVLHLIRVLTEAAEEMLATDLYERMAGSAYLNDAVPQKWQAAYDEVKVLANNLPVASGAVVVNRNRIAVEVKRMLPRMPDTR